MTPKRALVAVVLLAAVAFWSAPVNASDPVGVYCVIKKVVMEPDECAPTRVQVWGAFSFADARTGGYSDVMTGYLYYSVPKGANARTDELNGRAAQAEWNDFKAVAGTTEVVGFGGRRAAPGRVRAATDKPENPDEYPFNIGVVRMRDNVWARQAWYTDMAAALRRAATGR